MEQRVSKRSEGIKNTQREAKVLAVEMGEGHLDPGEGKKSLQPPA